MIVAREIQVFVADEPPQAWIGFALFVISVPWSIVANYRLYNAMLKSGVVFPRQLQGMAVFLYPFYRPRGSSRDLDRTALSAAIAVAVLVATVVLLGKYMWPGSGF